MTIDAKMYDIHTHILNNIDDGPNHITDSIQLCDISSNNGVKGIVATPHINCFDNLESKIKLRDRNIQKLKSEIDNKINLEIYKGFELFVNDDIFYFPHYDKVTINESRYILVEFDPFCKPNNLYKYCKEIVQNNYIPIIAHPEKMTLAFDDFEIIDYLKEKGCLFQLTPILLTNYSSERIIRLARLLLEYSVYDFIASDAHDIAYRHSNILETMNQTNILISQEYFDLLTIENPLAVINDKIIIPNK